MNLKISDIIISEDILKISEEYPFKWDGSRLDDIYDGQIEQIFYHKSFEYWIFRSRGYRTPCLIKRTKKYTHCLVDELKPLFGLIKLGTHYAKYKAGYIVLIRARLDLSGNNIVSDLLLSEWIGPMETEIIDKIKKIFIFRDLLCLSKSNDSSVALRCNDIKLGSYKPYPVSLVDCAVRCERFTDLTVSTYLPETMFNKWVRDDSPSLILSGMCNVYDKNKIPIRIFKLKQEITEATKRVCREELMNFPDLLISRILAKLQYNK